MAAVFVLDRPQPYRTISSRGRALKLKVVRAMSDQFQTVCAANDELDKFTRMAQQLSDTEPPPAPVRLAALQVLHAPVAESGSFGTSRPSGLRPAMSSNPDQHMR